MRHRPIALRGYGADGMLKRAALALPGQADESIRTLLDDETVAYIHAHNAAHGLYRAILQPPALTEEQSARLGEIEARRAELEAEMQDESISPDAYKALDQEDDRLIAEAEAIEHRAPVLPDELRPHVGAFLLLTPQGEMVLKQQFQEVSGTLGSGPAAVAVTGKLEGERIRFTAGGSQYTGVVRNRTIEGTVNTGNGIRPWRANQ